MYIMPELINTSLKIFLMEFLKYKAFSLNFFCLPPYPFFLHFLDKFPHHDCLIYRTWNL